MSTHQLRISDRTQINSRIHEFLGKKIQVVFNDNSSLIGELTNVSTGGFTLKNMLLKKTTRSLDSITEIYFDSLT